MSYLLGLVQGCWLSQSTRSALDDNSCIKHLSTDNLDIDVLFENIDLADLRSGQE